MSEDTVLYPDKSIAYRRGRIMSKYIPPRLDSQMDQIYYRPFGINPYPIWKGSNFSIDYLEWDKGYSDGVKETLGIIL